MIISVLLFIPYFRLAMPRKDYKARNYIVYALFLYILVNVLNAVVLLAWEIDIDTP